MSSQHLPRTADQYIRLYAQRHFPLFLGAVPRASELMQHPTAPRHYRSAKEAHEDFLYRRNRDPDVRHPLIPALLAHLTPEGLPVESGVGILPGSLVHAPSTDKRAGRQYSHAARYRPDFEALPALSNAMQSSQSALNLSQMILPGFARRRQRPTLPLQILNVSRQLERPGRAAPIALRVFMEAMRFSPYKARSRSRGGYLLVPLRWLLHRLYPRSRPSAKKWIADLQLAREVLGQMVVPYWDEERGMGISSQPCILPEFDLDVRGDARFVIHLPPGRDSGPVVSRELHRYSQSRSKYLALIQMAIDWYWPNHRSRKAPGRSDSRWFIQYRLDVYEPLTQDDIIGFTAPFTTRARRSNVARAGLQTLQALDKDGHCQLIRRGSDNFVLPPPPPTLDADKLDADGRYYIE